MCCIADTLLGTAGFAFVWSTVVMVCSRREDLEGFRIAYQQALAEIIKLVPV